VIVSVVTDLNQKAQSVILKPKDQTVMSARCIYFVKVSTTKKDLEIKLIPGVVNAEGLPDSYIFSDKNRLCTTSTFEIKASTTKKGLALTPVFMYM
jgi:hypothetical protein